MTYSKKLRRRSEAPDIPYQCPMGDWSGDSVAALDAHMHFWHEERPGDRLRRSDPVARSNVADSGRKDSGS